MSNILTQAQCSQAIGRIAAGGKSLQARITTVAVSTLVHAQTHGDTGLACRLLDALPSGQRTQALKVWFTHFSGKQMKFGKDAETGKFTCKLPARDEALFDIDGAMANDWSTFTRESTPTTFMIADLEKWLGNLGNKDGFHKGTSIPQVDQQVRAMAAKLVSVMRAA